MTGERGQAAVEVVAALPLAVAVVLALAHVLWAGAAEEAAGAAAHAGAVALLQEGDPHAAAIGALDRATASRARVDVSGRRVRVRVRPRALVPAVASMLVASAVADAGPGAVVAGPSGLQVRGGDGDGSRPGAGPR